MSWEEHCFNEHELSLLYPDEPTCICCKCDKILDDFEGYDYKDEYYCDECFEEVIEDLRDKSRR